MRGWSWIAKTGWSKDEFGEKVKTLLEEAKRLHAKQWTANVQCGTQGNLSGNMLWNLDVFDRRPWSGLHPRGEFQGRWAHGTDMRKMSASSRLGLNKTNLLCVNRHLAANGRVHLSCVCGGVILCSACWNGSANRWWKLRFPLSWMPIRANVLTEDLAIVTVTVPYVWISALGRFILWILKCASMGIFHSSWMLTNAVKWHWYRFFKKRTLTEYQLERWSDPQNSSELKGGSDLRSARWRRDWAIRKEISNIWQIWGTDFECLK